MLFALKNGDDFQGGNRLRFYAIGRGLKEDYYGTRGGGRKSFAPLLQGYGHEGAGASRRLTIPAERAPAGLWARGHRAQAGGLRSRQRGHRQGYGQEGTGASRRLTIPGGLNPTRGLRSQNAVLSAFFRK